MSQNIKHLKKYSVEVLNADLDSVSPTVDVAIYHVDNAPVSWESLLKQLSFAKQVYKNVGVQLRIVSAEQIMVPQDWLDINAETPMGDPSSFTDEAVLYDHIRQNQTALSKQAQPVFSSIIGHKAENSNTIQIITLKNVTLGYYEKNPDGQWKHLIVPTGALSFPSYIFEERIDRHLRGVITIQSGKSAATLAHELGHKLINVSHEGLECGPHFSGTKIPGLMGYHEETQIYSGHSGRWHLERLLLSPFLYTLQDGIKVYNPDYKQNGRYDDPIYGEYIRVD